MACSRGSRYSTRCLPCLRVDEIGNQVHRAGTIQRHQGDDVLEPVGPRLLQQIAHAARFELEHSGGVGAGEDLVDRRVVERNRLQRKFRPRLAVCPAADVAHRPVENRERASGRESRISPGRPPRHRPCRTALTTLSAPCAVYSGQKSVSLPGAISTPPACMPTLRVRPSSCPASASSSRTSSSLCSRSARRGSISRAIVQRDQLARLRTGSAWRARRCGRSAMSITRPTSRTTAFAAMVPKVAICDTALRAVLLLHVLDHPVAAVLAEVDVEVGHRYPLRIEEALEQQVVAQRIEVGDAERIGHQRARARAAPRSDRHAVATWPS